MAKLRPSLRYLSQLAQPRSQYLIRRNFHHSVPFRLSVTQLKMESKINLRTYLQERTQIDCDSLDLKIARNYGPFTDCTANQAESVTEFQNAERAELLKKSVAFAKEIHHEYPGVSIEELAMELCMVTVTLTTVPYISGNIHVMANPKLSYSTEKIIANATRIYDLCHRWDPDFDLSRLIIKMPSTWESFQACRQLKSDGIQTLATTLFSIQQAILAGEVGCISISPFVYSLKVHFDETYKEQDPVFQLCVDAQRYFKQFQYPTRVKACSLLTTDEVMRLAGIDALTLTPDLLAGLASDDEKARIAGLSIFDLESDFKRATVEQISYVDDEARFRRDFEADAGGRGKEKTDEAIEIFCGFQDEGEAMMKTLLDQISEDK